MAYPGEQTARNLVTDESNRTEPIASEQDTGRLAALGYGDVVPASIPAQILAVFQALLGYVGLGGLLSILANKMARRAD